MNYRLDQGVSAELAQMLTDAVGRPDTPAPVRLVAPTIASLFAAGRVEHCGHAEVPLTWVPWLPTLVSCSPCLRRQVGLSDGRYGYGMCDRCQRSRREGFQQFAYQVIAATVAVEVRIGLCSRCRGQ
jgi:hypothetical protein